MVLNVFKKLGRFSFFLLLFIIEFLALTSKPVETLSTGWDKLNHVLAFFTLSLFLSLFFSFSYKVRILLLLAYGIQIELVQTLTPTRFFSFADIAADILGILLGIFVVKIFYKPLCNLVKMS